MIYGQSDKIESSANKKFVDVEVGVGMLSLGSWDAEKSFIMNESQFYTVLWSLGTIASMKALPTSLCSVFLLQFRKI